MIKMSANKIICPLCDGTDNSNTELYFTNNKHSVTAEFECENCGKDFIVEYGFINSSGVDETDVGETEFQPYAQTDTIPVLKEKDS